MAQTTILQFLQEFCPSVGLPEPDSVFTSGDDNVLQLGKMCNRIADDLIRKKAWQVNVQEVVFSSVAAESQGSMQTLAPGYVKVLNNTIFDRTLRLPIYGPRTPHEWQQMKAIMNLGPIYQYRIVNGTLRILPTITAGHTLAFEYQSKNLFLAEDGSTTKQWASVDTDTFLLDDDLMLKGLIWKWKYEKGMPYQEDKDIFVEAVNGALQADATKGSIDLSGGQGNFRPGIFVPYGSWPVQ